MKNQKGITLVALVITIIVLLILAGVSISLVVGNGGILGKATNAVDANEQATVEQEIKLSIADAQMAYYTAWTSNQSVPKIDYYGAQSYYTNNCKSGAATVTPSGTTVSIKYVTKTNVTYNYSFDVDHPETLTAGAITGRN